MSRDEPGIHALRKIVVDGFLLCGLLLCLLATIYLWQPFERGFFCGDETLMFPYHGDTVSSTVLKIVSILPPLLTFLVCEWALLRSEPNERQFFGIRIPAWLRGFYCTAVSFGIGMLFSEIATNIAKNTIGRPRPHFFDACQPSVDCSAPQWQKRYIQSHEYHCQNPNTDLFHDMRKSFLSGHSSMSAYGMIFLALYLEKRMIWRGTRVLRHTLQFGAISVSWFIALSRVSDYKHHWSDVLAGYSLGVAIAVLVFHFCTDLVQRRKNHHPVPQHEITMNSNHQTTESA